MIEWIILGFAVLIILFVIFVYNDLVTTRLRVDNAFSQIDVQLKRRFDLIPNLVETVKGYAKHEKSVFENVTKARAATSKAGTMAQKAKAANMLTDALKTLFAVAENYPQLRATENFKDLQEQLKDTEEKIAYSRMFYNDSVQIYNTKLQVVPSSIIAGAFGFQAKEFFRTEGEQREAVKVKF
ncbi:MAG: LemA family protein [Candidatus Micrarchaeota archaeon]|nr:LemA family protein [Candidatus Micrarchaeota archaeon]